MAQRQFYQPSRRPSDDDNTYEHDEPLVPQSGKAEEARATSDRAGDFLNDLDSTLADNQASPGNLGADDLDAAEKGDRDTGPGPTKGEKTEANQLDNAVDQVGPGYHEEGAKGITRLRGSLASINRRRAIIGGGLTAGATSVVIAILLSLFPLKLVGLMTNLHDKFFGTSHSAVEKYSEQLFNGYMKKHVMPNLVTSKCHTTVDRNCIVSIAGEGKVAHLYRAWSEGRIENKLADRGLEFKYNTNTKRYYMNLSGRDINVSQWADGTVANLEDLHDIDRATVRTAVRDALKDETFLHRTLDRFSFWRLLHSKYHMPHCAVACSLVDDVSQRWVDGKLAAKSLLIERVIQPRSELLGLFFECISTKDCSAKTTVVNDYGDEVSVYDQELRQRLAVLSEKFNTKSVEDILKAAEEFNKKGFTVYVAEKIVKSIAGEAAAKSVGKGLSKAIPIVGWLDLAAQILDKLHNSRDTIKKFAYITAATAALNLFMLYMTHMDEIKSGHVSAATVGSFTDQLSNIPMTLPDGSQVMQSAESSPVYNYAAGSPTGQTALDLFSPSAFAASATSSNGYVCTDGSTLPADKSTCSDETFNINNTFVNALGVFQQQPLDFLGQVSDLWVRFPGKAFNAIGNLVAGLPGVSQSFSFVSGQMSKFLNPFLKAAIDYLVPFNITDNMTGAQTFTRLAAGGDVAGKDFAASLGGQALTPDQAAAIQSEQATDAQIAFSNKPLSKRLFDTGDTRSLASQMAMAIPLNKGLALQSSVSSLLNPLMHFSSLLSTPFASHKVHAAQTDPFGLTEIGYPLDDPAFNVDPETLTDSYCSDFTKQWAQNTSVDPNTGMEVHKTTNPCLLLDATITSLGAKYDASLVPSDASGSSSQTATPSDTGNPGSCVNPFAGSESSWGLSRTDQGVDFNPTGGGLSIKAICSGTVVSTSTVPGWPYLFVNGRNSGQPGAFFMYKITSPPPDHPELQNKCVYVAERITLAPGIKVGDTIKAGDPIAYTVDSQGPATEWGWAVGPGAPSTPYNGAADGTPMPGGKAFARFLRSLGAQTRDDPGSGPLFEGSSC